jgi:hypothetical protein
MIYYNELERVWNVAIMAYFKVLSQHFPGGSEENREGSEGIANFRQRVELKTSRIRRSANHSAGTYGKIVVVSLLK